MSMFWWIHMKWKCRCCLLLLFNANSSVIFLLKLTKTQDLARSFWRGRIFVDNISFPTSSNCHFFLFRNERSKPRQTVYTCISTIIPPYNCIYISIAHVAYEKRYRNCVNVVTTVWVSIFQRFEMISLSFLVVNRWTFWIYFATCRNQ